MNWRLWKRGGTLIMGAGKGSGCLDSCDVLFLCWGWWIEKGMGLEMRDWRIRNEAGMNWTGL